MAAIAVPPVPDRLLGIGIDSELPRPLDPAVARFFLRADEVDLATDPDRCLRWWTVKEALFKADPNNADTRLLDYHLQHPASDSALAGRRDDPRIRFCHHSFRGEHRGPVSIAAAIAMERRHITGSSAPMPPITFDVVAERIGELIPSTRGALTPQTPVTNLGVDSVALVEMVIDLQEEFDVILTHADLQRVDTIADLVALLAQDRGNAHVDSH